MASASVRHLTRTFRTTPSLCNSKACSSTSGPDFSRGHLVRVKVAPTLNAPHEYNNQNLRQVPTVQTVTRISSFPVFLGQVVWLSILPPAVQPTASKAGSWSAGGQVRSYPHPQEGWISDRGVAKAPGIAPFMRMDLPLATATYPTCGATKVSLLCFCAAASLPEAYLLPHQVTFSSSLIDSAFLLKYLRRHAWLALLLTTPEQPHIILLR